MRCGGHTDDGALALFLFARTAAALFDALEHAFSDTFAAAPPFLLDALALLVIRGLHGLQSMPFLERARREQRASF